MMKTTLVTTMTPRCLSLALALSLGISGVLASVPSVAASGSIYRGSTVYVREMRSADKLMQTGKYKEAESKYTALLQKNPGNLTVRSMLALSQAELFKLDAAEENARKVLSRNFNNAVAHMALGVSYRNRTASQDMTYKLQRDHYLTESAKELEKAVSLDPDSPEGLNQLGVTYRFQGRMKEAESAFTQAVSIDPDFSEALLNRGIVHLEKGDIAGAKRFYSQAVQRNSKNYMAHFRIGEALIKEGELHKAIRSLNTALSLDPGNASVLSKMAEAYDMQGNAAAAVTHYRKAIQANPGFMPAYNGLANLYEDRGDGELAMAELKSALNNNPLQNSARVQLGRLALSVDKPEYALQTFKEALVLEPKNPEVIQGMSQALTTVAQKSANASQITGYESDLVNAEQAVEEALRYNPDDLRLHLASLRISQLTGKPTASLREQQEILQRVPKTEREKLIKGEALLAMGRYEESDTVFHEVIDGARGDVDKLLMIGDTLKSNGDLTMAREAYLRVSRIEPQNLKAQRGVQRIEKVEAESQKNLRLAKALNNWRQKGSSVDFYEESLLKNPRQPEARLALAKLYEKSRDYAKAAVSYQFYLGLNPQLTDKDRQHYLRKIAKLQTLAQKNTSQEKPVILSKR